jgi:hypothetical protein
MFCFFFVFNALAILTRFGFCYEPLDGFERETSFEVSPYSLTALDVFYPTHLKIDFCAEYDLEKSHTILRNILRFPDGADNIREVSVSAACWPDNPGNFTLLEAAISSLDNIEKISWQADRPMTASFLRALESKDHPPRLYYTPDFQNNPKYWGDTHPFRNNTQKFLEDRIAILNSTILYSLTAVIENGYSTTDEDIDLIFAILYTCVNLRELELAVQDNHSCEPWNAPIEFDFQSRPTVKFPPLKVLRLKGYDFDAYPSGRNSWNRNDNDKRTNLDCWLQAMDWSHIHTLSLGDGAVYALAGLDVSMTKELKHISLLQRGDQFEDRILHFLHTSTVENTLESIEIQLDAEFLSLYPETFEDIILRQSNSLQSFTYKGTESAPVFLSAKDIRKLVEICGRLMSVDLTLERPEGEWPHWNSTFASLQPLIEARRLRYLSLRFPSPDLGKSWSELRHSDESGENPEEVPLPGESWFTIDWQGLEEWTRRFLQLGPGKQIDYPPGLNWEPPFDDYYGDYPGKLDPLINNTTMTNLFRKLRKGRRNVIERKGGEGVDIESIKVHVGDWDDRHTLTAMGGRKRLRVAYYECSLSDDGRESCAGTQERMSMYGG